MFRAQMPLFETALVSEAEPLASVGSVGVHDVLMLLTDCRYSLYVLLLDALVLHCLQSVLVRLDFCCCACLAVAAWMTLVQRRAWTSHCCM